MLVSGEKLREIRDEFEHQVTVFAAAHDAYHTTPCIRMVPLIPS